MRLRGAAGTAALFATLASGVAHAQSSASSRVLLDVIVEEGRNRPPLTASELSVSDADGPLPIESVHLVDLSDTAMPLPPVPATAGDEEAAANGASRLIGIYLDEYHLAPGAALEAARAALSAFVRTVLGPRDLLVVLKPLDSLPSIRLSADRDAAARVIESTEGRRGDYTPRSSFEHDYIAGAPERVDEARAQIAISALNALTTHLGQFAAGRKTLIVLSDGFTARMRGRRGEPLPGFDSVVRTAMRGRVAVYAFSPSASGGDVAGPDPGLPEASLRRLAEDTSGMAYSGADALERGLGRVANESSRYYLVSIEPRPDQRDGRVHRVSLSVRRPGAQVRARAGFSVVEPIARARDAALPPVPAARLVPRRASPLLRPWFGVDGADGGRLRVHVVWEPAGRVPGERAPLITPQRVRLEAMTLDGVQVYTGVSVAAGTERLSPDSGVGDPQQLTFETSPGPLLLQMEILDGAGRVLDRDVRDLPLRPFATPFAFGTPAVYRARTVRELRAILDGTGIAPTAGRQFTRTEHLVVRVPLVGTREVEVTARLVSGFGSVMRELPVTYRDDRVAAQVDLRLAGFAPGSYAVQFTARGTSGTVVDRLPFTLTP
jgi:VWFA-related protein